MATRRDPRTDALTIHGFTAERAGELIREALPSLLVAIDKDLEREEEAMSSLSMWVDQYRGWVESPTHGGSSRVRVWRGKPRRGGRLGLLHDQVTGWVRQPEWLAWS